MAGQTAAPIKDMNANSQRQKGMFPTAAWTQIAPYPVDKKKISVSEIVASILGIIGICIHWVVLFKWGLLLFVVPLILSILAIVFGYISIHRLFRKDYARENGEGNAGLAGLSLGILTLMFTIAWLVLAQTYLWGWEL
jgi:predicted permease